MKNFKRNLAGLMAVSMTFGTMATVAASAEDNHKAGGSGTIEAVITKEVFDVELPTTADVGGGYGFILDPQKLLFATSTKTNAQGEVISAAASRHNGADFTNDTLFFANVTKGSTTTLTAQYVTAADDAATVGTAEVRLETVAVSDTAAGAYTTGLSTDQATADAAIDAAVAADGTTHADGNGFAKASDNHWYEIQTVTDITDSDYADLANLGLTDGDQFVCKVVGSTTFSASDCEAVITTPAVAAVPIADNTGVAEADGNHIVKYAKSGSTWYKVKTVAAGDAALIAAGFATGDEYVDTGSTNDPADCVALTSSTSDTTTYSTSSDTAVIKNFSNSNVVVAIEGTVTNIDEKISFVGGTKEVADPQDATKKITVDVTPEDDKAQIKLTITGVGQEVDSDGKGVTEEVNDPNNAGQKITQAKMETKKVDFATKDSATTAKLETTLLGIDDSNFDVVYVDTDANGQPLAAADKKYVYELSSSFDTANVPTYTFNLTGAASFDESGKAWTGITKSPAVEVVWSVADPFKAADNSGNQQGGQQQGGQQQQVVDASPSVETVAADTSGADLEIPYSLGSGTGKVDSISSISFAAANASTFNKATLNKHYTLDDDKIVILSATAKLLDAGAKIKVQFSDGSKVTITLT